MPTLTANSPLEKLAEILHAAILLGPDSPSAGGSSERPTPSGNAPLGPDLATDLRELFKLLHDRAVPYLLVGGVALLRYIDGRNTQDIDLILSAPSLAALPEIKLSDQNREFARGTFKSVRVDLLLAEVPLFQLVAKNHATHHAFMEQQVPCATVEGLILLKLYALPTLYREGDGQRIGLYENDIYMLCQKYRPNTTALLETLRPFVTPGASEELGNIVADIQNRINRVEKRAF